MIDVPPGQGVQEALVRRTAKPVILCATVIAALLPSLAQAQTATEPGKDASQTAFDLATVWGCRPPEGAKEAQVLTFDRVSLEAKLAVVLGKDAFKVITVKLWDRPADPLPVAPIIEAARITQGKIQFFTPTLSPGPQPVYENNFFIAAGLGGEQVCWATPGSLLKDAARTANRATSSELAPSAPESAAEGRAATPPEAVRPGSRSRRARAL